MSHRRTNRAPRPDGAGGKREQSFRMGFPDTGTTRGLPLTPENDAKQAAYIDLVSFPGWKALLEDAGKDAQFWTEADDWANERGCIAYMAVSQLVPVPPEHMHSFLAGVMIGYERAISLPSRWLEGYARTKEKVEAVRKGLTVERPPEREGLRVDPTAPRPVAPQEQEGVEHGVRS